MSLNLYIIVSFSLAHVGQAEWCVNDFDAPYAIQPWEDFENCETEAASGLSKCWPSTFNGGKSLLHGCRKACTKCEASGADTCDEASWPDKDHGIVCGECKVLVNKFEDKYRTCGGYCHSLGLPCTGAWEEWEETCTVKHEIACDQTLSSTDAICECRPASSNGAWASTTLQAKVSSGVANDNVDGGASKFDDGSSRFVVSVIVGSCLVACLLCLSMCMFFKWKQAARTLRQRTDSDSTLWGGSTNSDQSMAEKASNVVLGNPMHDGQVGVPGGSEEKNAAPANGIVVGNPVNVGGNPVTPLSGGLLTP